MPTFETHYASFAGTLDKYYIPNHVHFVVDGDAAVFLDLRADQYRMLVGEKARAFGSLLSRARDPTRRVIAVDRRASAESLTVTDTLLGELFAHKLLTRTPSEALRPCIYIPPPEDSFIDSQDPEPPAVGLRDILRFLWCWLLASCRLRFATIESIVTAVARRNRMQGTEHSFDFGKARRLVRVYYRLRPFLPVSYMCLYDSLIMLNFLAQYGCRPHWVFAVRLEPWEAHCWVQYGSVAFNEETDRARTFLPIMMI